MPLVNDLLDELEGLLWFCALDMASGFWVVEMTSRAQKISAFVTPLGHFEWKRMPFGLKNAPQIYQRVMDNILYSMKRLPVLEDGDQLQTTRREFNVFQAGEVAPIDEGPILGKRSYIDDIVFEDETWEGIKKKTENFLIACREWNMTLSAPKGEFGKRTVSHLGHAVSKEGLKAKPKNLGELQNLEFPTSLKAMQSFLGSLNYYNRFIEDFAVYGAVLYSLREEHFQNKETDMTRAKKAFSTLKQKLIEAHQLRHFDQDKEPVVILYANEWAIAASLVQEHEGKLMPVKFTSRVLKSNERNYQSVEREILALLRMLDTSFNLLAGKRIRVLTRESTLGWLFKTAHTRGRLAQWAAILSPWDLVIERCKRGEEGLTSLLAASITPRDGVEAALEQIKPNLVKKQAAIPPIPPTYDAGNESFVISFDGSAKPVKKIGCCAAILWRLPEWIPIEAKTEMQGSTVNEAEYNGLILSLKLAIERKLQSVIICGDSDIVISQMLDRKECKADNLQRLRLEAKKLMAQLQECKLHHVVRMYNGSADLLTKQTMAQEAKIEVKLEEEAETLKLLNRLPEVILPIADGEVDETKVEVQVVTRYRSKNYETQTTEGTSPRPNNTEQLDGPERERKRKSRANYEPAEELVWEDVGWVEKARKERIRIAQDEEQWIYDLKCFLKGELTKLDREKVGTCGKLAIHFELDADGLLYYISTAKRKDSDGSRLYLRLVVPTTLHEDLLHHCHTSLQGGHQGINVTFERVRSSFYWRGQYKDVVEYVNGCQDCETGKGRPRLKGPSPGNIVGYYPFQVMAMDHIPSLPCSDKGNTELLVWVCLHTGFFICKATSSRTAQTIAEAYEEAVFRRFGASEVIRHDREPGFMSDVFKCFNKMMKQKQRATLAYRPQANGRAERMVQDITRAIKMYVEDERQTDWDDYAERLAFALNTRFNRARGDTAFYLVHGWDPKTTVESMLPFAKRTEKCNDAERWRRKIRRAHERARCVANAMQEEAVQERAEVHNENVGTPVELKIGETVWLYVDKVKPTCKKKLAHLWHGPFRVKKKISDSIYDLDTNGTGYKILSMVHISRLKRKFEAPFRPEAILVTDGMERFDFDEALLPEDSWLPDEQDGEYEVEEILDKSIERLANGKRVTKYHIKWKGYEETTWEPEENLSCGALLYEFDKKHKAKQRYNSMLADEDDGEEEE